MQPVILKGDVGALKCNRQAYQGDEEGLKAQNEALNGHLKA